MAEEKEYYSSPNDVIKYTGVRHEDFRLANSEDLTSMLEEWLVGIKNIIDEDRNRDFHQEVKTEKIDKIPPGIHWIALRIAANMVAQATIRRDSPILTVGEYAVKLVEDDVVTKSIKKDLQKYPFRPKIGITIPGSD